MVNKKLGIFLIALIAVISAAAMLTMMISDGGTEVGQLGVTGGVGQPCTGALTVTSSLVEGKCGLQADVVMKNCEGKWYVFKDNRCGGTLVCNGDIRGQPDRWRCTYEDEPGTYTFTLCENSEKKASATVTC
jgi:hypothetical protein